MFDGDRRERALFVLSTIIYYGVITQLFLFDLDKMNPLAILRDPLEELGEACLT